VFWVRDARSLTRWETAAPLRTLLRWTLRPLQMVHAAAVVGPRGAALLAGPSGAGKSTTALAAAEHGLGFVADDYCAVDLGSSRGTHRSTERARVVAAAPPGQHAGRPRRAREARALAARPPAHDRSRPARGGCCAGRAPDVNVSVVMAVRDGERYLAEALASVH